ncbi:MAG: hypothetical protein GY861_13000 [bacterium]|nr:hypothetical protein [bacterium]
MPGITGGVGIDSSQMAQQLIYGNRCGITSVRVKQYELSIAYHEAARGLDWVKYSCEADGFSAVVWGQMPAEFDVANTKQAFDNPQILKDIDGSWAMAATNGDVLLLATDCMASRPLFYWEGNPIRFSSEIKGLLPVIPKWSVDTHWLMDFLLFDFGWGARTIVNEVKAIPPGTVLIADKNTYSLHRYNDWSFQIGPDDPKTYVTRLAQSYANAVDNTVNVLPSGLKLGFDLSGGLDSRLLAAFARERIDYTFTYNSNPPTGRNPKIARQVAERLQLPNDCIDNADTKDWSMTLQDAIWACDGMKSWIHYHAMPFVWEELSERVDAMITVSGQGELFGEDIEEWFLNNHGIEALLDKYQKCPTVTAQELVILREYSPLDSVQDSVTEHESRLPRENILGAVYENFYPNFHYRAKPERAVIELVNPLISHDVICLAARMPKSLRAERHLSGRLPDACSKLKLELIRNIGAGLDNIPYERSYLAPKMPAFLHTCGFVGQYLQSKLKRSSSSATAYKLMYGDSEFSMLIEKGLRNLEDISEVNMDQVWMHWHKRNHGPDQTSIPILARLSTVGLWIDKASSIQTTVNL